MTRSYWIGSVVLVVVGLAASALLYPRMPDQIPTHWNIRGEVDDYGAKQWALFAMPVAMAAMLEVYKRPKEVNSLGAFDQALARLEHGLELDWRPN